MNILIINGSPRKKGLVSQMLSIMESEAELRDDKVQMVYTNDLTIKPCIGCMACRTKEKCVLAEDDSPRVLKMMQAVFSRHGKDEASETTDKASTTAPRHRRTQW